MDENELRDLQEQAHQIRELQSHPGWGALDRYCSRLINAKTKALLNGNAKTLEDYRGDAGWVAGALFVLQAAEQIDQQLEMALRLKAEYAAAAA